MRRFPIYIVIIVIITVAIIIIGTLYFKDKDMDKLHFSTSDDNTSQKTPMPEQKLEEFEGELVVVIKDDFKNNQSVNEYFLETKTGRYRLIFNNPPEVPARSIIKVKGTLRDLDIIVEN